VFSNSLLKHLPNTQNTTVAVNIDVKKSAIVTKNASLAKLLLTGLYDAKAIRQPKAKPNE
jgi:hypothetical protein